MRKYTIPQNMTLEYLLTDHLGSTSVTTDSNGEKVSEMRYKPFGEVRYAWTNAKTQPSYALMKYTFTGQYSYLDDPSTPASEGFGLMFYVSRWYDPSLGRFAQADTIVPTSTQGTQAWDRYAFVNNNPVRYTDPTGHCINFVQCMVEEASGLIKAGSLLLSRAIQKNGKVTNADWEDAANFGLPPEPNAKGTKISVSGTASVMFAGIKAGTFITTNDGDAQIFDEVGGGQALPQFSVSGTHGLIYGDLNHASDYQGASYQIFGSFSPEGIVGIAGDIWVNIPEGWNMDEPLRLLTVSEHRIGGVDIGASIGPGFPISAGHGITVAKPKDNYAYSFEGPALLTCRALFMCGR